MLKYEGKGVAYTSDGKLCQNECYSVEAQVAAVNPIFVEFKFSKTLLNGKVLNGQFRLDLNKHEMTSIAIGGMSQYISSRATLAHLRNTLVGPSRIVIEELLPQTDSLNDISEDERIVLSFIKSKAEDLLEIHGLVLMGSRADRCHSERSDFDIVLAASGGRGAWHQFQDIIRNESPTLAEIQVIDADSIKNPEFLGSVYRQGRFFHG